MLIGGLLEKVAVSGYVRLVEHQSYLGVRGMLIDATGCPEINEN
jgi:hypothetical protein